MGGKSFALKASILLAGIALLAIACLGQTFYGSIVGTVTDASGAILQGATVSLTNNGTGERRSAPTGADGIFRFVDLVPGNYKLDIEQKGFKHYTRDQIQVNVEATVRADVSMQVGEVTQSFQVTAEAALLQTESASLSQSVAARTVQELPLNGRNVLNLVTMVPGVIPQASSDGSLTGKNVFAAGNYQIGGGTANQSATLYDGIPMTTTYGNLVALVPSQDSVSEFRVQTNNNSAEYGRFTGGVINMASKSGSNQFHGDTFEFLRNKVLNANTFFANAAGLSRPPFVQNQFGSSIGGPVKKDKLFFFAAYEGFRQHAGNTFTDTVPTTQMLKGDFSGYLNGSGGLITIYDPLTQCGQYNNGACPATGAQRTPFPGNVIPTNRINPVSLAYVNYPAFALPTGSGANFTHNFNFNRNVATGGSNDQGNFRGDWNVSDNQRILARYTRWKSANLPVNTYGNGFLQGDPYSPEGFITDQAVLADTFSLSPTTIFDVRAGFMRWFYGRTPGHVGTDLAKTFGFPAYMNTIDAGNGFSNSSTPPYLSISGYNFIGGGLLYSRDNTYTLTTSLVKIIGRHTLKFGAEWRRMDINYFQNNQPGGVYTFDNLFTAASNAGGGTGGSFASFLLGDVASGIQQIAPFTAGGMHYQGYYANDAFQVGSRLTVNLGVRWEIPGVYTERFNNLVTFDPTLVNPVTANAPVNGQPLKGAFVLVDTPGHPERGLRPEQWHLFAPRIGLAYRLSDKTVIRTGAGEFFAPANINFPEGPCQSPVNYIINQMVSTNNSSITPVNTFNNPFPNGFVYAPGRNPNFQQRLLGVASVKFPLENINYPYTMQWNFTIQHQFRGDAAVEASYVGLKGTNLSQGAYQINAIPTSLLSMGSALQQQVPNPLYGLASNGTITQPTVQRGQLLLPFPQYTSGADPGAYMGNSTYEALQAKVEKRFSSGGMLLAAYTFSKVISNVETLTTWLDTNATSGTGLGGIQDWYNMRGERAISSFDSRSRLTVSYVVDLPFGKGKKLLPGVKGVADKIVSGWGVNGLTTFQDGFPLAFTATPNLTGFNTGLRPNVAAGCNPVIGGAIQQRLNKDFNTACYSVPGIWTFGSEGRTDPVLRGAGVNNWNASIFKKTAISERFNLEFRAEAFNLFNRVQFGNPGLVASTAAGNTFGIISTQLNSPRLIQLALRLTY
jgi:outer membrane receptor protein involved in Fe transport